MEVIGQLQNPTPLSPRKQPLASIKECEGYEHSDCERCGDIINLLPLPVIELRTTRSLVTMLIMLSRLPKEKETCQNRNT